MGKRGRAYYDDDDDDDGISSSEEGETDDGGGNDDRAIGWPRLSNTLQTPTVDLFAPSSHGPSPTKTIFLVYP